MSALLGRLGRDRFLFWLELAEEEVVGVGQGEQLAQLSFDLLRFWLR